MVGKARSELTHKLGYRVLEQSFEIAFVGWNVDDDEGERFEAVAERVIERRRRRVKRVSLKRPYSMVMLGRGSLGMLLLGFELH